MTLNFKSDVDPSDSDSEIEEVIGIESDDDEDYESSDDDDGIITVFDNTKEINYNVKYKDIIEQSVNLTDVYVNYIDVKKLGQTLKIAAAISGTICKVYDFKDSEKIDEDLLCHEKNIVDVKFGLTSQSSSLVYTGSEDGTINLWDLRLKENCVNVYKDNTDSSLKPLSCFDVSCDGRYLVAGTEVINDDAFLLFWDVRTTKLLGGYWDTHQGDITQVKFHPTQEKTVISGSVDGIINLFDITQTSEKDAFQSSFNTNSSVRNLRWLKNQNNDSIISCITHTEDVQLWHTTDASPYITIPRDTVGKAMHVKPEDYSQVIDCHQTDNNGNIMMLVGNNHGKGEHLQSHNINDGPELSPRTLFKHNNQIIRCSWYDYDCGMLITGGEAGMFNVWIPSEENKVNITTEKCSLKELPKVSLKNCSSKPY